MHTLYRLTSILALVVLTACNLIPTVDTPMYLFLSVEQLWEGKTPQTLFATEGRLVRVDSLQPAQEPLICDGAELPPGSEETVQYVWRLESPRDSAIFIEARQNFCKTGIPLAYRLNLYEMYSRVTIIGQIGEDHILMIEEMY